MELSPTTLPYLTKPIASQSSDLCSWLCAINCTSSWLPPRAQLLARIVHRTQKNKCALDYQFIWKGCSSGTARVRDVLDKVTGKGRGLLWPLAVAAQFFQKFTPNPSPLVCCRNFSWHDWINHWLLVTKSIFSPSPSLWEWDWKFQLSSPTRQSLVTWQSASFVHGHFWEVTSLTQVGLKGACHE